MSDQPNTPPDLSAKLTETESLLARAREALDASERKRQIERELFAENALDVETAAMLTEAVVAGMDKADVRAAVADLRKRKPFLFRATTPRTSSVMGGHAQSDPLADAAAAARDSGDRRALLKYLRLRRNA
jgi:hypothetical protein